MSLPLQAHIRHTMLSKQRCCGKWHTCQQVPHLPHDSHHSHHLAPETAANSASYYLVIQPRPPPPNPRPAPLSVHALPAVAPWDCQRSRGQTEAFRAQTETEALQYQEMWQQQESTHAYAPTDEQARVLKASFFLFWKRDPRARAPLHPLALAPAPSSLARPPASCLHQGAREALLRLFYGFVKALLRLF
jgi:hypothetical protein